MPLELNGAPESTVGPIRDALLASQKSRSLRFPAAATAPPSAELPDLAGNAGKVLVVNVGENGIEFATMSGGGGGSGDVVGPSTATDNAIARFDTTSGKLLQNSAVTISDDGKLGLPAAAAGYASLNIPHGTAPTSPSNGDVWTTSAGLYVRVGGVTVGPLSAGGGGGGGLTYFTEARSNASPNATVTVASFTVTDAATNVDIALCPKGTGAVLAHIPDSAAAGGNKRGSNAVDLQTARNTASMVASGSGSVICGGGFNQASGTYATICGGYNSYATGTHNAVGGGQNNSAGGNSSAISGGQGNQATADYSAIGGGQTNKTQSGSHAAIAGGQENTGAGAHSSIGGGYQNSTAGQVSCAPGGRNNTASALGSFAHGQYSTASISGQWAYASGVFGSGGDAQACLYVLRLQTSTATPAALATDANAAGAGNTVVLGNNAAVRYRGQVIARSSAGDVKSWDISGTIKRGSGAGTAALVGTPSVVSTDEDAGATAWAVTLTANTTTGGLAVTVTGAAATTIRWLARIETVELRG